MTDSPYEAGELYELIDEVEKKKYRLVELANLIPRAIKWVWRNRIAAGTISIVAGPGGIGKGAMWVDLAAQVTRGELDSDFDGPINVLILTAEERIEDVIVPRLRAAGAVMSGVRVFSMADGEYDRDATLPEDIDSLREALKEFPADLIIIDPLNAHLSERIDSHKDAQLRRALAPLARFASEAQVAVVGVAHVNKGRGDAVNRVLGSVGYVNAARTVLIVGRAPGSDEDSLDRIVALPKSNNSPQVPSLRFRLESRSIEGVLPDGSDGDISVVGVTWLGEDSASADELLGSYEERSALTDAMRFLKDILADGPVAKSDVVKAARTESISHGTLHRAGKALGVISKRDDEKQGRPAVWKLPNSYVPRVIRQHSLAHNHQAPDQGEQRDLGGYVPDTGVGTKPLNDSSSESDLTKTNCAVCEHPIPGAHRHTCSELPDPM